MKVVVITGASRGIGENIVKKLATENFNFAILSRRNKSLLLNLENFLSDLGRSCLSDTFDASDFYKCEDFIEKVIKKFGKIDLLINCAGISHYDLFQNTSPETFDKVLKSNLYSTFNMCKLCVPFMLKQKSGKIINISSIWGKVGASHEVAYSTSKGAINTFTKALAKELAPSNIQVNAILPGLIDTDMNKNLSTEDLNYVINNIPALRIGKVEEISDLVSYLVNANSYLTGQCICVDGSFI